MKKQEQKTPTQLKINFNELANKSNTKVIPLNYFENKLLISQILNRNR